jgi:transposase
MPRAYSQDLRDRVIDAVVQGGESRRAAARRFGVSDASAVKWLQRFERLGDREHAVLGGYRKSRIKAHREWLLAVIATEPDMTLAALCDRLFAEHGLRTDTGSLSRFFGSEGISFKKNRAAQRAGSAGRGAPPDQLEALPGPARP